MFNLKVYYAGLPVTVCKVKANLRFTLVWCFALLYLHYFWRCISWAPAAYGLAPGCYLLIKPQPHLSTGGHAHERPKHGNQKENKEMPIGVRVF